MAAGGSHCSSLYMLNPLPTVAPERCMAARSCHRLFTPPSKRPPHSSTLNAARLQVAATDSDLSCQGCPTSDTRARITATTTYPYSALGELIGQLGTSNECAPT